MCAPSSQPSSLILQCKWCSVPVGWWIRQENPFALGFDDSCLTLLFCKRRERKTTNNIVMLKQKTVVSTIFFLWHLTLMKRGRGDAIKGEAQKQITAIWVLRRGQWGGQHFLFEVQRRGVGKNIWSPGPSLCPNVSRPDDPIRAKNPERPCPILQKFQRREAGRRRPLGDSFLTLPRFDKFFLSLRFCHCLGGKIYCSSHRSG